MSNYLFVLDVEHIQPKATGGSNKVSNLCLACEKCNLKKNSEVSNSASQQSFSGGLGLATN